MEAIMIKKLSIIATVSAAGLATASLFAEEKQMTPAEGYNIHVLAPHRHEDGTVRGPYHHYCKPISAEILQCMIFESTDPKAPLVEIEYFVDKKLARSTVSLKEWNKHYHDHEVEIATGRVQVLDVPPEKAKEIAEAAAKTDGIIFHLWYYPEDKVPTGRVGFPTSVGHKPRTE
jgi:uncharacterized protein DUF1264